MRKYWILAGITGMLVWLIMACVPLAEFEPPTPPDAFFFASTYNCLLSYDASSPTSLSLAGTFTCDHRIDRFKYDHEQSLIAAWYPADDQCTVFDASNPAFLVPIGSYTKDGIDVAVPVNKDYLLGACDDEFTIAKRSGNTFTQIADIQYFGGELLGNPKDMTISPDNNYAYLVTNDALYTIDISDLANPEIIRKNEAFEYRSIDEFLTIEGTQLIARDGDSVVILDITDPSSITKVKSIYCYSEPRFVLNDLIYTCDSWTVDVKIYDLTTSEHLATIEPPSSLRTFTVYDAGEHIYLYLLTWYDGVVIFDVTDPTNPAYVDTISSIPVGYNATKVYEL